VVRKVVVEGWGLHTGQRARALLSRREGPVGLRARGVEATIAELSIVATTRATTVEAHGGALRVATVEHLFAALAGLGVHDGLLVEVDGPELPLLDGGASQWAAALDAMEIEGGRRPARVTRAQTIDVGASRYELSPGPTCEIEVSVDFDDARLATSARWSGDAREFREHIAPARTFALARDVEELARLGLARRVEPASVVLVTPEAIHWAGRGFSPDEPARHKLLDLLGDLYLHGGAPIGRVRAFRPGHASNAEAFRVARETGALVAVPRPVTAW
jgi:UDP-3-O-[3-hydroxymyristoyl] N-acetylglucosamine deacetylase